MADKKLDTLRPYGVIYGSNRGAAYYQDGQEFDGAGNLLGTQPEAAPEPAPEPEPEPEDSQEDTRAELEALHPMKIKELMTMRGLTPFKGPGSKKKNIEALLLDDSG